MANEKLIEGLAVYDVADQKWEDAKAALEAATVERSEAVKVIAEAIAPAKKFLRSGRELTIVVRPSADGTTSTFFFRGSKESKGLIEV